MSPIDAEELKQQLNIRLVTVTFTKLNDDERVMMCTTNLDLIPPDHHPHGKLKLSEEKAGLVIRAYDVKAQGWRSFHADRVKDML